MVPYFKGKLKGDIVGQAIGDAIQKINAKANNGIGPSVEEIMKGAYDAFSKGKDLFDKGKDFFKTINDFYEKQKKAGATNLQPLGNLVKLGAGGWGGAFAAVGAGMSIYESFFSDPEPMQLAIELAIRATMTGSVFTEYQPAYHEFYLPGRFSIQDAFNSDQHSKMPKLVNAAIPRYDRTLGHLGYRYDPGTLEFRVLRRDCSQSQPDYDKGTFEEYPSQWDWFTSYYFPAVAKPVTTYPLYQYCPGYTQWMDLSVNAKPPKIEKLLPIIYNPYAEITPMKPTIVKQIKKTPPQNFQDDRQWFWWIHDNSWKTHIKPESDDKTFPIKAVTEGYGPAIHVRVFNGSGGHAAAKGFIKDCNDPSGRKGIVSAKGVGIMLDVKPMANCVPGTYRNFKDITNLDTDTWRWGSFSKEDPMTHKKKYFDPKDPFPLHDVIFYWDVAYFYYGRSRKKNGIVPRSFEITSLQSPVTIDVTRHVFSCESGQQSVNETHKHAKVKSQLLLQ